MATTISRHAYNDDTGDGETGDVWNAALIGTSIYDKIDALIAANIVFGGSITERGRSLAMGEWTSTAFSAGNYSANGSMTWVPTTGDQITLAHSIVGKTYKLAFWISLSDVGGTANSQLKITLPGGVSAAKFMGGPFKYSDNGTQGTGWWSTDPGDPTKLILQKDIAGTNWTLSTDNTTVIGVVEFEIT